MTQNFERVMRGRRKVALVRQLSGGLATLSNCGKFLKPLLPQPPERDGAHQGNDLGDGNNIEDATMDNLQPSATGASSGAYACSSTTKW